MKKITVLGSTGSVGQTVLQVASFLQDDIKVEAIAAHSSIDLLLEQALKFRPKLIAVYTQAKAVELEEKLKLAKVCTKVVCGINGLLEAATLDTIDMLVCAMSGTHSLVPTLEAIKRGKEIALANKEILVAAGQLVQNQLDQNGSAKIIPLDSEHSAIFQCLAGENQSEVKKLILTASGGPFLNYSNEKLNRITVAEALNHPTWQMGPKISVDSSTLMNKGLEIIEAHWLFNISVDNIEVVVHPQSIIHSLVEFVDGSIKAQMGVPTMITPVQYALTYPNRLRSCCNTLDFKQRLQLDFFPPDLDKFKCLSIAYHSLKVGGSMPCYMNAVNENLVNLFLQNKILWCEIPLFLEKLISSYQSYSINSIEDILAVEELAKQDVLHRND